MIHKTLRNASIAFVTSAILLGCGSSASSSGGGDEADTPEVQTTISGKAVDGYLKSATVVLDLDSNGYLTAGEPVTATDVNGSFELTITDTHRANSGFDTAQLIIYDGIDTDTGNRYLGKLKAPNDGTSTINVTPITTQVAAVVKASIASGGLSADEIKTKITEAKAKVKTALGIPSSIDVDADPIALAKAGSTVDTQTFLGANIALQKAVDTMVKAAKEDAGNGNIDEHVLASKMFEALALGLNELGDNETGIGKLIEKAVNNTEAKSLMGEKAAASHKAAIQVAIKTLDVFESDDFNSGDNIAEAIIKASLIAEDYRDKLVEKFDDAGFDFNISDDSFSTGSFDGIDINLDFDFEKERLKNIFADQNLSDDVLDKLKEKLDADIQFDDIAERLKADAEFAKIGEEIENQIKKDEEEQRTKENLASTETIVFSNPETFSYLDSREDYSDGQFKRTYSYGDVTLGDNTITFVDYSYNTTTSNWDERTDNSDDGLTLVNGEWVSESNEETISRSSDNKEITINNELLTKNYEDDLSGERYIRELDKVVTFPKGSISYGIKIEELEDYYYLHEQVKDYYVSGQPTLSTLKAVIESQCGNKYFMGNQDGGISFAGTKNSDGTYTCDGDATSGKLFAISNEFDEDGHYSNEVYNTDAGTWEIKTVDTQTILVVTPNNPKEFSYDDEEYREEYTIFAPITDSSGQTTIYRGNLELKGSINSFPMYNKIALDALKAAVKVVVNEKEDDSTSSDEGSSNDDSSSHEYVSPGINEQSAPTDLSAAGKTYFLGYKDCEDNSNICKKIGVEIKFSDTTVSITEVTNSSGTISTDDNEVNYYTQHEDTITIQPSGDDGVMTVKLERFFSNGIEIYSQEVGNEGDKEFLFNTKADMESYLSNL